MDSAIAGFFIQLSGFQGLQSYWWHLKHWLYRNWDFGGCSDFLTRQFCCFSPAKDSSLMQSSLHLHPGTRILFSCISVMFIYEYFFRTCLCFMNIHFSAGAWKHPHISSWAAAQEQLSPPSRPLPVCLHCVLVPGVYSAASGHVVPYICALLHFVSAALSALGLFSHRASPQAPLQSGAWLAWGHCSFPGAKVWLLVKTPLVLPGGVRRFCASYYFDLFSGCFIL